MSEETTNARNEVIAAIAKASGNIKRLVKGDKNKHDDYTFASVDDFLAMVNPICAAEGLVILMDEAGIEDFTRKGKYGENAWMRVRFQITAYHTSGQSMPTVSRTVEVLRNGPQAYGSAQSFVLKQFLRALLLISTGDKDDADFTPTDEGTITKHKATITADQLIELQGLASEAGVSEDTIALAVGAPSLEELPEHDFARVQKKLKLTIESKAVKEPHDGTAQ